MPILRRAAPFLLCLATLLTLASVARFHPIGTYGTETDFYLYYAPDAARITAGEIPASTFHGPGYALALAAVAPIAGDFFTAGKWISIAAMAAVVFLSFVLFRRLFGYGTGLAAALLVAVSGRLPQYAVSATTDVLFVALLLAAVVALTTESWDEWVRVAVSGGISGVAWLTRYNAVSLIVAIGIAILVIDLYGRPFRRRLVLAGVFAAALVIATAPWLTANWSKNGSPLYNTNYLNVAKELYPSVAQGYSGDDALLLTGRVFHSFGDVLRHDPAQALRQYPRNVLAHLRGTFTQSVAGPAVPWLALAGLALAWRRHSKALTLLLVAALLHFAVVGLVHYESRFHFFVTVLYSGLAIFAIVRLFESLHERGTMSARFASAAAFLMVVTLCTLTLAQSLYYVRRMLSSQPFELLRACESMNARAIPHRTIVARKPHLPYLCGSTFVLFPQVRSLDELHSWLATNRVDVVYFGVPEAATRREIAFLLEPRNAPPWLRPVWASTNPPAALYRPTDSRNREAGQRGGSEKVTSTRPVSATAGM